MYLLYRFLIGSLLHELIGSGWTVIIGSNFSDLKEQRCQLNLFNTYIYLHNMILDLNGKNKLLLVITGVLVILIVSSLTVRAIFYSSKDQEPAAATETETATAESTKANKTSEKKPVPLVLPVKLPLHNLSKINIADEPEMIVDSATGITRLVSNDPDDPNDATKLQPSNASNPPNVTEPLADLFESSDSDSDGGGGCGGAEEDIKEDAKSTDSDTDTEKEEELETLPLSSNTTSAYASANDENQADSNVDVPQAVNTIESEPGALNTSDNPSVIKSEPSPAPEPAKTYYQRLSSTITSYFAAPAPEDANKQQENTEPDVDIVVRRSDPHVCSGQVECGAFDILFGDEPRYRVFYAYSHNADIARVMTTLEEMKSRGFELGSVFGFMRKFEIQDTNGVVLFDCWVPDFDDRNDSIKIEPSELLRKTQKSGFMGAYELYKDRNAAWTYEDFYLILPFNQITEQTKVINADVEIDYSRKRGSSSEIENVYEIEKSTVGYLFTTKYTLRAREIEMNFANSEHTALEIQFYNKTITDKKWPSNSFHFRNLKADNINSIAFEGLNVLYSYNHTGRDIIQVLENLKANGAADELTKQYNSGTGIYSVEFSVIIFGPRDQLEAFKKE